MAVTYECLPFGLLVTDDVGEAGEKCVIVSKQEFNAVTRPDEDSINDLCKSLCADCGCEFVEYVSNLDLTPLYVEQQISTDTITFEIRKKDGTGQVISDSSLGTFVDNTSWIADWNLIRNLYGNGTYNIIINYDILGVQSTKTSHDFVLSSFDLCKSKGQVKFQWWVSGSIEDGREFGETERYYEARLKGFMFMETPETETETYLSGSRELKTIQTTQKRIYKFQSKLLKFAQMDMIIDNIAFGDRFIITDYNANTKDYNNLELKLEKVDSLEDKAGTNEYTVVLAFTNLIQNKVKRPC